MPRFNFEIIDDCIVYSDKQYSKLKAAAAEMSAETSPEAFMEAANQVADPSDPDTFWDYLDAFEKVLDKIRIDLINEHGNAIPPESYIQRAREVINSNPCKTPFTSENLDIDNLKRLSKQFENDKLNWSEAAWNLFTSSKSTLKSSTHHKPQELRDVKLNITPKRGNDTIER